MFYKCDVLLSIQDISNINYSNDNTLILNEIKDEFDLSNEYYQNDWIFNQNEE